MEQVEKKALRLLELYSGIGGMRYGLEFTGVPYEVAAAVDINPVVNCIYRHNFGNLNHFQRNIQSYTSTEVEEMNPDIIMMSPPCQPFTRVGKKKDIDDARSESFVHILNVLSDLHRKPKYFLLENVKGFEESEAHGILMETLMNCGYAFQEFLLSPDDFGFPNSRRRYFVIAKLKPFKFSFPVVHEVISKMPKPMGNWKSVCIKSHGIRLTSECHMLHFLEEQPEDFSLFSVPDKALLRYGKIFDIVHEDSCHSCCFTKAYARYALGTGSVYTPCGYGEVSSLYHDANDAKNETEQLQYLRKLRLRYFTPKEVANLMAFPKTFSFPRTVNDKQQYKALGNSLNVFVVSRLLKLLFDGE